MDKILDNIKKHLPLAYGLFVFYGILHEFIYYYLFDINITSYIDLTEVLLLMFDESIGILVFAFIGGIYVLIIDSANDFITKAISKLHKQWNNIKSSRYVASGVPVLLWFIYNVIYEDSEKDETAFLGFALGMFLTLAQTSLKIKKGKKVYYSFLILTLFVIVHPIGVKKRILESKSKKTVQLSSTVPFNSDSLKLIGETRNYVFLFNMNDSTTITLHRTLVSSIVGKTKSD